MDTERPSPRYTDIDVWEPSDILEAMIGGQFSAVAAIRPHASNCWHGGKKARRAVR